MLSSPVAYVHQGWPISHRHRQRMSGTDLSGMQGKGAWLSLAKTDANWLFRMLALVSLSV